MPKRTKELKEKVEHSLDEALDDSFPASDPVSFLQAAPLREGDKELSTVKVGGRKPSRPESLEQDLLAIEEEMWVGGPRAFERHCDEQCMVVFAQMTGVMAKADIAKGAKKGRWQDVVIEPKGMMRLSDGAVVVTYECSAKRRDGQPYRALVGSGYRKRPGGWKLAFHQQTPIQPQATE